MTVTAESPPLQTDVALRKTDRGEGHRAAVVLGPQPDRRRRPEGRRHRRQLQQLRLLGPRQRRLQHQRQPHRREQHHGRRRDRDPHAVERRDRRHPERRRDPGSPGADRRTTCPSTAASSGGQIRIVTKSGSNRFSGSGSFFYRDDKLQANTWTRNQQPERDREQRRRRRSTTSSTATRSAARSDARTSCSSSRAQEWVNYLAVQTNTATVPTAKMRHGDFSELLDPEQRLLQHARRSSRDPLTGQPFPNNVIPASRLSRERPRVAERLPAADARLPAGHRQRDLQQRQPAGSAEGQHPLRLPAEQRATSSPTATRKYNWTAVDAFRGTFPFARTDWDRPNTTQTSSWTSTITQQPDQRSQLHLLARPGVHQRVHRATSTSAAVPASTIRTSSRRTRRSRTRSRRSPSTTSPRSTAVRIPRRRRARSTRSRTRTTWVKGRHTFKGGVVVRVLGRGRLRPDQRPADSRQHQQPERPLRVPRQRDRRAPALGIADAALGLFTQLRRDRPARVHQVAGARDRRLRPGLLEAARAT